MMPGSPQMAEERLRAASRRLALTRHEMIRPAELAKTPEALDAELPVRSRADFLRRLRDRAQAKGRRAAVCLLALDAEGDMRLACQILYRNSRRDDAIGRAGAREFVLLLEDADERGAQRAAVRLGRLLARTGPVRAAVLPLAAAAREESPLRALRARLCAVL